MVIVAKMYDEESGLTAPFRFFNSGLEGLNVKLLDTSTNKYSIKRALDLYEIRNTKHFIIGLCDEYIMEYPKISYTALGGIEFCGDIYEFRNITVEEEDEYGNRCYIVPYYDTKIEEGYEIVFPNGNDSRLVVEEEDASCVWLLGSNVVVPIFDLVFQCYMKTGHLPEKKAFTISTDVTNIIIAPNNKLKNILLKAKMAGYKSDFFQDNDYYESPEMSVWYETSK